jgi:hypothetical protein
MELERIAGGRPDSLGDPADNMLEIYPCYCINWHTIKRGSKWPHIGQILRVDNHRHACRIGEGGKQACGFPQAERRATAATRASSSGASTGLDT